MKKGMVFVLSLFFLIVAISTGFSYESDLTDILLTQAIIDFNGTNVYESGFDTEDELPNIKGYWKGPWETFKTDNDGVVTDPNGQLIIDQQGEMAIHITEQKSNGEISGTIEIIGWDINENPDLEDVTKEIEFTGWLDKTNGWFNAHYFYFTGPEYKSDYYNLIADYKWNFYCSLTCIFLRV